MKPLTAGVRPSVSFAPAWWMRLATLPRTTVATIGQRERLRKSTVLGIILFFTLLLSLPLLCEYALTQSFLTYVVLVFIAFTVVAALINQHGHVQTATFFYLIAFTITLTWGLWASIPSSPLSFLWE